MTMNGIVLAGMSPPSLSSHHSRIGAVILVRVGRHDQRHDAGQEVVALRDLAGDRRWRGFRTGRRSRSSASKC